jgi:predicted transposase YbfD/YdcC
MKNRKAWQIMAGLHWKKEVKAEREVCKAQGKTEG